MITIGIDPGVRGCGVAIFADKELRVAAYVKGSYSKLHPLKLAQICGDNVSHWISKQMGLGKPVIPCAGVLAIEVPVSYGEAQQRKGDQNDLINVAMVSAACASLMPQFELVGYYPRDWKGTIDADVMTTRIKSRLSVIEAGQVWCVGAELDHNTYDAIGIGLHTLGRLKQERKIFR